MFKPLSVFILLVCPIIFSMAACSVSPLGRRQVKMMPASQMSTMGIQAFNQMKTSIPQEKDPAMNRYVKCISKELLKALPLESHFTPDGWELVVFQDKSANAFALPGKKIGVHTGLLDVAVTPGQLAAVIGHEIGHVIAEHGNERVSQAFIAQGGLAVVSSLLNEKQGAQYQMLMAAIGIGAQVGYLLPHSRTQESEADIIGLRLMARAGFDPEESIHLWENMGKASGAGSPEFLSTHPSHGTRIHRLRASLRDVAPLYQTKIKQETPPNCSRS